jgi:hypothetical protein
VFVEFGLIWIRIGPTGGFGGAAQVQVQERANEQLLSID